MDLSSRPAQVVYGSHRIETSMDGAIMVLRQVQKALDDGTTALASIADGEKSTVFTVGAGIPILLQLSVGVDANGGPIL